MKLQIIFEDSEILVLNKPAGLVVNRSQTIKEETLQDLLSEYFNLGPSLGIGDRAGIVHRLDRETSGLLLVAKTQKSFENLQDQFKERKVEKEYVALVHGHIKDEKVEIKNKIVRIGKFGKFLACSGFPDCKHTESLEEKINVKKVVDYWTGSAEDNYQTAKYLLEGKRYPDCFFLPLDD